MARAERKSRIQTSPLAATESTDSINALVRDLIDKLIVPMLVEEFLRQYGPASAIKQESSGQGFQSDSAINFTP
jgi:hypothetical protein